MKEVKYQYDAKPAPLYYEVLSCTGELLFKDECYAICNSFIIVNQIKGVRPKPVYE
jgi:hypothetical protein